MCSAVLPLKSKKRFGCHSEANYSYSNFHTVTDVQLLHNDNPWCALLYCNFNAVINCLFPCLVYIRLTELMDVPTVPQRPCKGISKCPICSIFSCYKFSLSIWFAFLAFTALLGLWQTFITTRDGGVGRSNTRKPPQSGPWTEVRVLAFIRCSYSNASSWLIQLWLTWVCPSNICCLPRLFLLKKASCSLSVPILLWPDWPGFGQPQIIPSVNTLSCLKYAFSIRDEMHLVWVEGETQTEVGWLTQRERRLADTFWTC